MSKTELFPALKTGIYSRSGQSITTVLAMVVSIGCMALAGYVFGYDRGYSDYFTQSLRPSRQTSTQQPLKNMHDHGEKGTTEVTTKIPTVSLAVQPDSDAGWNLQVTTTNFTFKPESAGNAHKLNEGHAHLYIDGVKLARLYGNWFHIPKLPPGKHTIEVTLNSNDHKVYTTQSKSITATTEITQP